MDQAKEKPKTLLLRKRLPPGAAVEHSDRWERLAKALKTFTDFEDRVLDTLEANSLQPLMEGCDHLFLDAQLAPWKLLEQSPISALTVVFAESLPWHELEMRTLAFKTLTRHPCLVLDSTPTTDLVRTLHLFLTPKRLGGITPMMEKGSLIVGEKAMISNNIGSMMDRLCAYFDSVDSLELKSRIPDLRQTLTALIQEGLRCSQTAKVAYPYVDFQASASRKKIGINIRFPRGELSFEQLITKILSGQNIFWHQIWQCSDICILTHHKQHEEIEATILLCAQEQNSDLRIKTLLHKVQDRSARKENLLDAPDSFIFKVLSDIRIQDSEQIFFSENTSGTIEEIDLGSLPENISKKITSLDAQCIALNDQLKKKDTQLKEATVKAQQANRELGTKRSELIRALQANEAQSESANRRAQELEAKLELAKKTASEATAAKGGLSSAAMQETLTRMEAMLRIAEGEKQQLRESISHEQKRVAMFEQKLSHLYKEGSLKEREINELKSTFAKMRKEQVSKQNIQREKTDVGEKGLDKLKEAEEREITFKQEVRKLTFKLESQEKNTKAIQQESAEKLKMLDLKLKEAKAKEIELIKKIEELTNSLKKVAKAA